jgi:hypothetical protein
MEEKAVALKVEEEKSDDELVARTEWSNGNQTEIRMTARVIQVSVGAMNKPSPAD